MNELFPNFPDHARVWVFALAKELSQAQHGVATARLDEFLNTWKSHGTPVKGAYRILEHRFILIAGYVGDDVSGCSTDSMMRVLKSLREEHSIDGFDRTLVFYRDHVGQVRAVNREEFQTLVDARHVGENTAVFDATIQTVGALRAGLFETAFARAWHATAFFR